MANPLNDLIVQIRQHDQWLRAADKRIAEMVTVINAQGAALKRLEAALSAAPAQRIVQSAQNENTASRPVAGWDYSGEDDAEFSS